jgi:hypothetical protein
VQAHPFRGPTAFIAGNEGFGLPAEHQALCDHFVYIPQYSEGTASLNVTVATSIVMHHFAVWARYAEAPRDPAAPESDRADHGPWGAYDGWPAKTADGLLALGLPDQAAALFDRADRILPGAYEVLLTKSRQTLIPASGLSSPLGPRRVMEALSAGEADIVLATASLLAALQSACWSVPAGGCSRCLPHAMHRRRLRPSAADPRVSTPSGHAPKIGGGGLQRLARRMGVLVAALGSAAAGGGVRPR